MKQINLLPWREYKEKLKMKQFVIVWFFVSCSCIILLFSAKTLILQQIKHYQLAIDGILLQVKTLSPTTQKIKQLQFASNELQEITKIIQTNHQQIKKILDFIKQLKYLITPDIFVRFIEFHPPYFSIIMRADSKRECAALIKLLKFKYDKNLQWLLLNKGQGLYVDFIIQMLLDKH